MNDILQNLLKNMGCSYCHEYETSSSNSINENKNLNSTQNMNMNEHSTLLKNIYFKSWKLYLKEFENYSAMILYHPVFNKDIIELIPNTEKLKLFDVDHNLILVLEFISKNDDNSTSIWVPSEEYQDFYFRINEQEKEYDKHIDAYFIGKYDIE